MDIIMICIGIAVIFGFIVIAGAGVWYIRKKGGIDMKNKVERKPVEDIMEEEVQEPNDDQDIEAIEEEAEPVVKKPSLPFCSIVMNNGKVYQGYYLGENASWLQIKTEKIPLAAFKQSNIVMVTFDRLPAVAQPQKVVRKPIVNDLEVE